MAKRNRPLPEITRQRLNAGQALRNLEWVEGELRGRYKELDLGEIPALREYAAIQRWKISKCLPDLKPVDNNEDSTDRQHITVSVATHD